MSFDPQKHYQDHRVARSYDQERFSSLAGRVFQTAELKALERLMRHIGSGTSLLDIPCGTGRIAAMLIHWGCAVTCADISQEMINVSRSRLNHGAGNLHFSRASAAALPFLNDSFNAVMSMRFLPHISTEPRRSMLKEMARVSQRWVVFSNSFSSGWYQGRRAIKRYLGHQAPTRFPVTEQELQADLESAGLREVKRTWTFRFLSEELLVLCEKKTKS